MGWIRAVNNLCSPTELGVGLFSRPFGARFVHNLSYSKARIKG